LREKVTRRAIHRHHTGVRTALIAALLGLLITGCGGVAGGDRPNEDATLLLDSAPDAVHAGIYLATERGFDESEGVRLEVRRPGASTDAPEQLRRGRADMAILDTHALGRARDRGRDVVAVYAVVQRPLRPRERGRRPRAAVPPSAGAPPYPELVLCVTRSTLEDRRPLVRAAIRALQRGYVQAQAEPDSAVTALQEPAPGSDRKALTAQLDAVSPAFTAGARAPGELRRDVLRRWAASLHEPLDVSQAFDFDQVGPVRNP
jgi:ABC-type nitrate/sulfonate/bicarbonate transport system substrate-binding protein